MKYALLASAALVTACSAPAPTAPAVPLPKAPVVNATHVSPFLCGGCVDPLTGRSGYLVTAGRCQPC